MKHIKTNSKLARQSGTTLIELSVVIAVLLLLVGVLFIGVQAWQNAANNAACLVNQSTIQKAARGYANFNGKNVGDALAFTDLTTAPAGGAAMLGVIPACPIGQTPYVNGPDGATVPAIGHEYAVCNTTNANGNGAPHVPANTANW
jgi:type II secretory pathway pseudopilin PulG